MQRRVPTSSHKNSSDGVDPKHQILPLTHGDIAHDHNNNSTARIYKRITNNFSPWIGFGFLALLFLISLVWWQMGHRNDDSFTMSKSGPIAIQPPLHGNTDDSNDLLPLHQFPSLQYALRNSHIVALYFAASWCPASTPITNLIHTHLDSILLPVPPMSDGNGEEVQEEPYQQPLVQKYGLSLVFISSDRDENSMREYMGENWFHAPFASTERDDIQRHFKTCARPDMEHLHMTKRNHEIPTLLLVSGQTHDTLTFRGAEDLQDWKAQAVDSWMELVRVSDALSEKYVY